MTMQESVNKVNQTIEAYFGRLVLLGCLGLFGWQLAQIVSHTQQLVKINDSVLSMNLLVQQHYSAENDRIEELITVTRTQSGQIEQLREAVEHQNEVIAHLTERVFGHGVGIP